MPISPSMKEKISLKSKKLKTKNKLRSWESNTPKIKPNSMPSKRRSKTSMPRLSLRRTSDPRSWKNTLISLLSKSLKSRIKWLINWRVNSTRSSPSKRRPFKLSWNNNLPLLELTRVKSSITSRSSLDKRKIMSLRWKTNSKRSYLPLRRKMLRRPRKKLRRLNKLRKRCWRLNSQSKSRVLPRNSSQRRSRLYPRAEKMLHRAKAILKKCLRPLRQSF